MDMRESERGPTQTRASARVIIVEVRIILSQSKAEGGREQPLSESGNLRARGVMYGSRLFLGDRRPPLLPLLPINDLPEGYVSRDAAISKTVVLDMADIALPLQRAPVLMTNGRLK